MKLLKKSHVSFLNFVKNLLLRVNGDTMLAVYMVNKINEINGCFSGAPGLAGSSLFSFHPLVLKKNHWG